jgi:pimeloyl-ACP methyl ester carboxylesterase
LASSMRLVYLDHRGNGRSTGDAATATMATWAADAAAVTTTPLPSFWTS